jgi:hypothetical protein
MPEPEPTDGDIDAVREVAGENDGAYVLTLIDNLNDAEWARALDFVTAWNEIAPGDLLGLGGGRDGLKLSDQEGLDDLRKRMRLLLGLPEFRDWSLTGGPATIGVRTEWRW